VSQRRDDGENRVCLIAIADFQVKEKGVLLSYSRTSMNDYPSWKDCPTQEETYQKLVADGKIPRGTCGVPWARLRSSKTTIRATPSLHSRIRSKPIRHSQNLNTHPELPPICRPHNSRMDTLHRTASYIHRSDYEPRFPHRHRFSFSASELQSLVV
jgi:hypothetical protein